MSKKLDVSVFLYPILMGLVYVLFRHPLVRDYLSPYLLSVEVLLGALWLSSLLGALWSGASTLMKGIGLALAVYLLPLNLGFDYRLPLATIIVGISVASLSTNLGEVPAFALRGAGVALILFGLYLGASQFAPAEGLGGAFKYAAIGVILAYSLAVLEVAGLLGGRFFVRNLGLIVAVFAIYGFYYTIRPHLVQTNPRVVFYFDWGILAFTVLLSASAVQNYLTQRNLENYLVGEWSRHESKVSLFGDGELEGARKAIEDFVLHVRKTPLVMYLTYHGARTLGEERAREISEPIIEYSKPCLSNFTPGWYVKRVERRELERRVELVKKALEEIEKELEGRR